LERPHKIEKENLCKDEEENKEPSKNVFKMGYRLEQV
jgi:hypothetical protein